MGLKSAFPMFPVLVHLGFYNKISWTGCLQSAENYFSQFWGLRSPQSKCWWGTTSWFTTGSLSPVSYMVNGSISPSGVSFMRALIPFVMAPPSWPNHPQSPHLLIPSPLGFRMSTCEFWGHTNIQTLWCTWRGWGKSGELVSSWTAGLTFLIQKKMSALCIL